MKRDWEAESGMWDRGGRGIGREMVENRRDGGIGGSVCYKFGSEGRARSG